MNRWCWFASIVRRALNTGANTTFTWQDVSFIVKLKLKMNLLGKETKNPKENHKWFRFKYILRLKVLDHPSLAKFKIISKDKIHVHFKSQMKYQGNQPQIQHKSNQTKRLILSKFLQTNLKKYKNPQLSNSSNKNYRYFSRKLTHFTKKKNKNKCKTLKRNSKRRLLKKTKKLIICNLSSKLNCTRVGSWAIKKLSWKIIWLEINLNWKVSKNNLKNKLRSVEWENWYSEWTRVGKRRSKWKMQSLNKNMN